MTTPTFEKSEPGSDSSSPLFSGADTRIEVGDGSAEAAWPLGKAGKAAGSPTWAPQLNIPITTATKRPHRSRAAFKSMMKDPKSPARIAKNADHNGSASPKVDGLAPSKGANRLSDKAVFG